MKKLRRASRRECRRSIRLQPLEDRRLLAATAVEQDLIYLLNRARHDPVAYAAEQNLPVSLAGVTPRGPLAVNSALLDSADVKAIDLITNDYFDHVSPSGVHPNRLARDAGYPLPDVWSDDANFIESLSAGPETAAESLNLLIIDEGLPDVPHRAHLLGTNDFFARNREIGVGFANEPTTTFEDYWVLHLAQRTEPVSFLTGVVHEDVDGNQRYGEGEGLAGVLVTVDGTLQTRTNAAGGWSVQVQPGQHSVVVSGGNFAGFATASATVTDDNVAIDFISGQLSSYVDFDERYATNVTSKFDVNDQDGTSALDALQILNFLGRQANGGSLSSDRPIFLDVSGDGNVSSIDALQVINELQRLDLAATETELVPAVHVTYVLANQVDSSLHENVKRQDPALRDADVASDQIANLPATPIQLGRVNSSALEMITNSPPAAESQPSDSNRLDLDLALRDLLLSNRW